MPHTHTHTEPSPSTANAACSATSPSSGTAGGAVAGSAVLQRWKRDLDADASKPLDVPETLLSLEGSCELGAHTEFWRCFAIALAFELCGQSVANSKEALTLLRERQHEWRKDCRGDFDSARLAISGEIALFFDRFFGDHEEKAVPPVAKSNNRKTKGRKVAIDQAVQSAESFQKKLMKMPGTGPASLAVVNNQRHVAEAEAKNYGPVEFLPVVSLVASPFQSRSAPSPEWLKELADSLDNDGQLTPCVVRALPAGGHEIIAGHTRVAAAKSLRWVNVACRVIECDDLTARRLVLVDNAKRRDLTPLETAVAISALVTEYKSAGKSQRDLAGDLGISQAEISNSVRMLMLPAAVQQLVITGEITKTQARDLMPWADLPAEFWDQFIDGLNDEHCSFEDAMQDALWSHSYPLQGTYNRDGRYLPVLIGLRDTPEFDEIRAELDIRKIDNTERAFNGTKWSELQNAAEAKKKASDEKKKAKDIKKAESGEKAVDPRQQEKAAEQFNKKLYRYKLHWIQRRANALLSDQSVADPVLLPLLAYFCLTSGVSSDVATEVVGCGGWGREAYFTVVGRLAVQPFDSQAETMRSMLQQWVCNTVDGPHTNTPPEFVELLANLLKIDIEKQWTMEAEFVELLTAAQLQEQCTEWKLKPATTKRGDLAAWLMEAGAKKPCPKILKNVKAVSLSY